MKTSSFLLAFLFTTIITWSQNPAPVIIIGEVKDVTADLEQPIVKAFIRDFGEEDTRIRSNYIENDNTFKLTFELDRPQDIHFSCGKYFRFLYVKPGDSLHVTFLPATKNNMSPLKVMNGDTTMNNRIDLFMSDLNAAFPEHWSSDSLYNLEPAMFKSSRLAYMQAQLKFLQSYISEHNINYPLFQNWAKHEIIYQTGKELFDYAFMQSSKTKSRDIFQNESESYFDFFDEIPLENPEATNNNTYSLYIRYHWMAFPAWTARSHFGGDTPLPMDSLPKRMIDAISAYTTGFSREVMLTVAFLSGMKFLKTSPFYQAHLEDYFNLINDSALRKKVSKLYNVINNEAPSHAIESLNKLQFPDSVKNILPAILEKHKGKVIVLDFWGTWCAPCLAELERLYPELVPKFNPEKVVFVFLANSSIKGIWEKKVSELKFKGDHYFLNGGQSAVMSEIFGVSALPHHAIIDAEGNIVEKKVTEVSASLINSYLRH